APSGWGVKQTPNREPDGGRGRREMPTRSTRYEVSVPPTAAITQPYFLEEPRAGDSYRWPQASVKGMPFDQSPLIGQVGLTIGGIDLIATQPVEYRFADQIRGELRRMPNVVPKLTVGLDTSLLVVPLGTTSLQKRIVARVASGSLEPVSGTLRLRV